MTISRPELTVDGLTKRFTSKTSLLGRPLRSINAVQDVTFSMEKGETLGLVGESGSGKSTTARLILGLERPTAGSITYADTDITHLTEARRRPLRRKMQMVFQDPFASLNPRMTIRQILTYPLQFHGIGVLRAEREERVAEAMRLVGLPAAFLDRYPHEFSGGQRQRIGIARALVVEPEFVLADEPVSALDVSIQAQIINLLLDLKEQLGLSLLFISHDLAIVALLAQRTAVMYLGRIVEIGPTKELFLRPRHPYTEALLSAMPVMNGRARQARIRLEGELPSPEFPPSGCVFRTRCRYALPGCAETVPEARSAGSGHSFHCIRDLDLLGVAPGGAQNAIS